MIEKRVCADCGTELGADLADGACPKCLFRRAQATATSSESATSESSTVVSSPGEAAVSLPASGVGTIPYFGDYELLAEIARGGMGVVYKARQTSLNRVVALKMILTGVLAGKKEVERFYAEAEAAANLSHPNIVPIYEIGQHDGQHYFSMELVEGGALTQQMARLSKNLRAAAELMGKVARAVHHAHQRGILHRDLKPGNILLDTQGEPRITDFGLAKRVETESDLTLSGAVLGTPSYMPPEQALGRTKQLTTAADVYSLGAILYELFTGRPPFQADSTLEILRKIVEEEPVRPGSINPRIDRDLETICLKCLEKDPQRRYGSAEALAQDLERWIRNEPIQARPVKTWERMVKWAKRRPAMAAMTGAIAAVAILGLAGIFWQWRQAEAARAIAVQKVADEAKAKLNEVREKQRAEDALAQMEIQKAEDLFASADASGALAYLAAVLRRNPTNRVAAERIMAALMQRNFALPAYKPFYKYASCAEFSRDGKRILMGSTDNTARIFEVASGKPITADLKHRITNPGFSGFGRHGGIQDAQFSPDGTRALTASGDGSARLWDSATGKFLFELLHRRSTSSARFSQDGTRIVTASQDNTARIWDSQTGLPVSDSLQNQTPVLFAEFSPNGDYVLTVGFSDLRIWDARSGRPVGQPTHIGNVIKAAHFDAGGRRVVLAAGNSAPPLFEVIDHNLRPVKHESAGSESLRSIGVAVLSPDGQRLLTDISPKEARLWNTSSGEPLTEAIAALDAVLDAQFSPDGLRLAMISADGRARFYNGRNGEQFMEPIRVSEKGLNRYSSGIAASVRFSADGKKMVTWSQSGNAVMWNVSAGLPMGLTFRHEQPSGPWHSEPATVTDARFDPRGDRLATSSTDGTVRLWDAKTGRLAFPPLPHPGEVKRIEFSPDGRILAAIYGDPGSVRVWDARTGGLLVSDIKEDGGMAFVRFSPDGKTLITCMDAGGAHAWETATGRSLGRLSDNSVKSVEFAADGKRLISAGPAGAQEWLLLPGEPISQARKITALPTHYQFAHYSFDGNRVVALARDTDRAAEVWMADGGGASTNAPDNAVSPTPLGMRIVHDGPIAAAEFSPDGTMVLTASRDRTARVWDSATGQPLVEPMKHGAPVTTAHFSPDNLRVVTATEEGAVRVWDARTGQPLGDSLLQRGPHATFSPDGQWVLSWGDDRAHLTEVPMANSPVPAWLPGLAEAVGGQRLSLQRSLETVPWQSFAAIQSETTTNAPSDRYGRLAQWVFAGPSNRGVSPEATASVGDYLNSLITEGPSVIMERPGLLKALLISPTNALALARITRHALQFGIADRTRGVAMPDDPDSNALRKKRFAAQWASNLEEARFFLGRGMFYAPDNPEVLWSQAVVLLRDQHFDDAFKVMELAAARPPADPDFWNQWGGLLEGKGRVPEAFAAFENALDLAAPADASALTDLARKALDTSSFGRSARQFFEADWYSRRAVELAPTNAAVWAVRARVCLRTNRFDEAFKAIDQAIRLSPETPEWWNIKGDIYDLAGRLDEAEKILAKGIELADVPAPFFNETLSGLLRKRSRLFERQNRHQEARADFMRANHIQPRVPGQRPDLIDLTAFFNAGLPRDWRSDTNSGGSSALFPYGVAKLGEVEFDIRGVVQLTSGFPNRAGPIPVNLKCRFLHFLHGRGLAATPVFHGMPVLPTDSEEGASIGAYRVHYSDGQEIEIPLVYGEDLRNWTGADLRPLKRATRVWEGTTPAEIMGWLFKLSWENPLPSVEIKSIDFVAQSDFSTPFLIAVSGLNSSPVSPTDNSK